MATARVISVDDVVVTGAGMVCSLGHDVVTACAAARAGLLRISRLDAFPVGDDEVAGGATPVAVHAIAHVTRGFEGGARLLRIFHAAIADLLRGPWSPGVVPDGVRWYLSVPDPARTRGGLERMTPEARAAIEAAGPGGAPEPLPSAAGRVLGRALDLAEWPGAGRRPPSVGAASCAGHAGVLEVLERAVEDVRAGKTPMAIVGGADSLLDAPTLQWLQDTGRLKTPDRATGVMPGEAGVFLALESGVAARSRRARVLARVQGLAFAREPDPVLTGRASRGRMLAEVVAAASPGARWSRPSDVWVLSDMNGEDHRAAEWGNAFAHLQTMSPLLASPRMGYPAASLGDVGGAFGGAAACLAAAAFVRAYAPHSAAAIVASSDGGARAAAVLARPEG